MSGWADARIWITGASSGIGEALVDVDAFVRRGALDDEAVQNSAVRTLRAGDEERVAVMLPGPRKREVTKGHDEAFWYGTIFVRLRAFVLSWSRQRHSASSMSSNPIGADSTMTLGTLWVARLALTTRASS
jgi:hypothetical protein